MKSLIVHFVIIVTADSVVETLSFNTAGGRSEL